MTLSRRALSIALCLAAGLIAPDGDAADEEKIVTLAMVSGARIQLDGELDEEVWDQAPVFELVQQEPKPGEPTRYPTQFQVLSDGENLYIGVIAHDPETNRLSVHTMYRDSLMEGDDTIAVVLDTFGDRRSGFVFRINAAGARQDGLVDASGAVSLEWDGIWDAAVHRRPDGWRAEFRIPARTLRFRPEQATWGFNIERHVPRELLTLRWAGISLDAKFSDLRRAGTLVGAREMERGLGLAVTPYVLGGVRSGVEGQDRAFEGDAGLDVTYGFTSQLAAVLTVNTDFAESEVDARQINLSRFPLFFPEKRAFFLEGANHFDFGLGLDDIFIPFFSRRVGLVEGREVPIVAGLKMVGRQGKMGVGLLDVQTDDAQTAPASNLFAGRLTYDVTDELRVGTIITNGDPATREENRLFGADATWSTATFLGDKNLTLNAWGAASQGDLPEGQNTGWGVAAFYPNDLWDLQAHVFEFGDGLDPALGFLPRPGTRHYRAEANWQPRPGERWPWVRQYFAEMRYIRVDGLDGRNQSWLLWTAPFKVLTEAGEDIEVNYMPQGETLEAPFEIAPGVTIPSGEYDFDRYRVTVRSSTSRRWRIGARVWFGDFFTGQLTTVESLVGLTALSGHLRLLLELVNNYADLPQGNFDRHVAKLRLNYDFGPNLSLSSFTQYDNESKVLGLNNRLRWTLTPGRDLFLVWNRGWTTERDLLSPAIQPPTNEISLKLTWGFFW